MISAQIYPDIMSVRQAKTSTLFASKSLQALSVLCHQNRRCANSSFWGQATRCSWYKTGTCSALSLELVLALGRRVRQLLPPCLVPRALGGGTSPAAHALRRRRTCFSAWTGQRPYSAINSCYQHSALPAGPAMPLASGRGCGGHVHVALHSHQYVPCWPSGPRRPHAAPRPPARPRTRAPPATASPSSTQPAAAKFDVSNGYWQHPLSTSASRSQEPNGSALKVQCVAAVHTCRCHSIAIPVPCQGLHDDLSNSEAADMRLPGTGRRESPARCAPGWRRASAGGAPPATRPHHGSARARPCRRARPSGVLPAAARRAAHRSKPMAPFGIDE